MTDSSVASATNTATEDVGAATAGDPYAPNSGNGGYGAERYALDLDYRVNTNRLTGTAVLSLRATQVLRKFSLDLVGMSVSAVLVDGVRASRFSQGSGKLTITVSRPIAADAAFTVEVRYAGSPSPRRSSWGEVGWEELADGVLIAGQPTGAPTWFPCNDHPSDKAIYSISITLASSYRAVANGRLVSNRARASRTQWRFESTEPMATYLATLQIGVYREQPVEDRPVAQRAYFPDDLAREFADDFGRQPAMIETFERLFGPYPFEQYAVVVTDDELEIPLEAQGLSIFGRNHVDGVGGSQRLIAHELAHSWFGNSLTASSWKHIWLHEGFACYAEWLWAENSGGPTAHELALQHWPRVKAQDEDFAIGDPGAELMFDDRLYKRGALALHAVRLTLGDELFFRMLRDWTSRYRHGSVSTAEFLAHLDDYSGRDLTPMLHKWLFEHELPRLPRKR
ncbi:MAG TPA: M1 family metallopeptidase [Galbitalea sp.]